MKGHLGRDFPMQSLRGVAPSDPQHSHLISDFKVTCLQPDQLTPAIL